MVAQPRYLLDTNVLIDAADGRADGALHRFRAHQRGDLAISIITLAELERGWQAGQGNPAEKDVLLTYLMVLPFDEAAATGFGRVMVSGPKTKATFDRLIAGHALSLGLTLVTSDKTGFANIEGLSVEDWSA